MYYGELEQAFTQDDIWEAALLRQEIRNYNLERALSAEQHRLRSALWVRWHACPGLVRRQALVVLTVMGEIYENPYRHDSFDSDFAELFSIRGGDYRVPA